MNDHELDDQMRHLAQSYNEPPATPRAEMWAQIEHARAGASRGAARRMYWLRMSAGIAAVLVAGIGIGRLTNDIGRTAPAARVASSTPAPDRDSGGGAGGVLASMSSPDSDLTDSGSPAAGAPSGALAANTRSEPATNPVRADRAERLAALRAERQGQSRTLTALGSARGAQAAPGDPGDRGAYRLAVVEHMARSEVLLTSFLADSRSSPGDARTAAQFSALSRDLLKTTRLLLATRTADDPALTRLLEDLELVLMQISQYSSEGRRGDLDAINQSLDRRNVLPKLRSAIPAGASTGI
jgi:hypothetical protein